MYGAILSVQIHVGKYYFTSLSREGSRFGVQTFDNLGGSPCGCLEEGLGESTSKGLGCVSCVGLS